MGNDLFDVDTPTSPLVLVIRNELKYDRRNQLSM